MTPITDTQAAELTFRPIDEAAKTGEVMLIRKDSRPPEAAYWNLAPMATGADNRYPWTTLDPATGTNGWSDGKHGPTEYMPLSEVLALLADRDHREAELAEATHQHHGALDILGPFAPECGEDLIGVALAMVKRLIAAEADLAEAYRALNRWTATSFEGTPDWPTVVKARAFVKDHPHD